MTKTARKDHLAALAAPLLAHPEVIEELDVAMKTMQDNNNNEAAFERLITAVAAAEALTSPLDEALEEMWRARLAEVSHAGRLKPVTPDVGVSIFEELWEKLRTSGWDELREYEQKDLAKALALSMRSGLAETAETPEAAGAALDAALSTGTAPGSKGYPDCFRSFADGRVLSFEMQDWQPHLFQIRDGRRQDPVPKPNGIIFHTTVDFPTGKVLISDSIRVGGFPDIVLDNIHSQGLSLNYAFHRIIRTALQARDLGLVNVAMADDGPDMVLDPATGRVYAGRPDTAFPMLARVCHDYWGTMMIDRATLEETLMEADEAAADIAVQLETWLEGSFATEVDLAPGTWHLYWRDDRVSLDEPALAAGITVPEDSMFMLSPNPIDFNPAILRSLAR